MCERLGNEAERHGKANKSTYTQDSSFFKELPYIRWDSNPRHFALQATAPPTELPVQLTHTHYLRHVQVLYCIDGTSTVAKEFGVLQFL